MFAQERHNQILSLLRKHRDLDVQELTGRLGISPTTLRRDLNHLDQNNQVLRVHGGVFLPGSNPEEASLTQKAANAIKAKRRIAARIAETIPQGASVFIDGGTTCLEGGLLLRLRVDLTIITNSLPLIAGYERFEAKLIVLGGERRAVSGALVEALAIKFLYQLRAVALFGCKINLSESPLAFIEFLRRVVDGEISPTDAVKAYHGILQQTDIQPQRNLQQDLQLTTNRMSYR